MKLTVLTSRIVTSKLLNHFNVEDRRESVSMHTHNADRGARGQEIVHELRESTSSMPSLLELERSQQRLHVQIESIKTIHMCTET